MKNIFIIFLSATFLTGCIQNSTMLGPAITVATTGSIQQAAISKVVDLGIKKKTGKNINEHAVSSLKEEIRDCSEYHSNELNKIFFKTLDEIDCKVVD